MAHLTGFMKVIVKIPEIGRLLLSLIRGSFWHELCVVVV